MAHPLFVAGALEELIRIDLKTRAIVRFSEFLLDTDVHPNNVLVAIDSSTLINCREKTIVSYTTGVDDGNNVLKVRWQVPIKARGDCQAIQFYDDRSIAIGTDKGELQIFDYKSRKFLRPLASDVQDLQSGIDDLTGSARGTLLARNLVYEYVAIVPSTRNGFP